MMVAIFPLLSLLFPLALAQYPPPGPRYGGVLVGDQTLDAVYMTRDLDGDGNVEDSSEVSVFFEATNVLYIHSATSGYMYAADLDTAAVYRLEDNNYDGDVLDEGESSVWFSEQDNFNGFTLPQPNGVFEVDDAVYIANAGTTDKPFDAVYRTVDLNGDGDANDEGEAVVWLDIGKETEELLGGNFTDTTSFPFEIVFVKGDQEAGDCVAYIAEYAGVFETNMILRAQDLNGDGQIKTADGELTVFIDENNPYGVEMFLSLAIFNNNKLVVHNFLSENITLWQLDDLDGNGKIDDESEVTLLWDEATAILPDDSPANLDFPFALATSPTAPGEIFIGGEGQDESGDNVYRLVDLDNDGAFLSDGETILWRSGQDAGTLNERVRCMEVLHEFFAARGYLAVSVVDYHNQLPQDIVDIRTALEHDYDWATVQDIYTNNKNSISSTYTVLSLQYLADGVDPDPVKDFDNLFEEDVEYFGRPDFLDAFLLNVIAGTGHFADSTNALRSHALRGALWSTMSYWVRFEGRYSRAKADDGNFACAKGAPHNWDEGAAFFYGPRGRGSVYELATLMTQRWNAEPALEDTMFAAFQDGVERIAPTPPEIGQKDCPTGEASAVYPTEEYEIIEETLCRIHLLALLDVASQMSDGTLSSEERKSAQSMGQGLYLGAAVAVYEVSPEADEQIQKYLYSDSVMRSGVALVKLINRVFDPINNEIKPDPVGKKSFKSEGKKSKSDGKKSKSDGKKSKDMSKEDDGGKSKSGFGKKKHV